MTRRLRGRPLKFGRPAQLLALTLPHDVVAALRRLHPDPAWAIVSLCEGLAHTDHRPRPASVPALELAQISPSSALIVVDPQAIRSVPGMSVVPVASGRAFLAFEEGRGVADLELAVAEQIRDPRTSAAVRRDLKALRREIGAWRRSRGYRLSTRSIILVERVRPPTRGRGARPRLRPRRSSLR